MSGFDSIIERLGNDPYFPLDIVIADNEDAVRENLQRSGVVLNERLTAAGVQSILMSKIDAGKMDEVRDLIDVPFLHSGGWETPAKLFFDTYGYPGGSFVQAVDSYLAERDNPAPKSASHVKTTALVVAAVAIIIALTYH